MYDVNDVSVYIYIHVLYSYLPITTMRDGIMIKYDVIEFEIKYLVKCIDAIDHGRLVLRLSFVIRSPITSCSFA